MVMLSVLYTNARQVLQVQACKHADVSKSTGLTAWQIKCAKEHANRYSIEELEYMLYMIEKCESGIKTGTMDEDVAVPYVLTHVL